MVLVGLGGGAVFLLGLFLLLPLRLNLGVLSGVIALLLVGDFLQSVEFFSVELIQFRVDIFDGEVSVGKSPAINGMMRDVHLIVFSVRGIMTCSLLKAEFSDVSTKTLCSCCSYIAFTVVES